MGSTIDIKTAAARWGLTDRRVNELCKMGRIEGAYKEGKRWFIPNDAQKPTDLRRKGKTAELPTVTNTNRKLPVPIGISDYRKASTQYYYVDKTLLIRDFIDERPQVSLFTRPRRFGKTLNMDMLRTFFERTDEDTSIYFHNMKIWQCGNEYRSLQGKYPVIFITFKDVKYNTWDEALSNISKIIQAEFRRHKELLDSSECDAYEKRYFNSILDGTATAVDMANALLMLSQMLDEHYGIAPIIIIDEYDTPIQQGYISGYYDDVILFLRNLFSGGLKDNRHLSYGFLTGILRVAKESIFSGLNNLKTNSILDNKYSEYFGFTPDEIKEMAEYYGVPEKYAEICEWYDGYRFGNQEIFNPWSVISYFGAECMPQTFWQFTGSNDIISEILAEATPDTMERLQSLMQGKSFVTHIDTSVIYPQIKSDPSSIYSFLLVAGYLKMVNREVFGDGYMCEVALPNREISYVYRKEILSKLDDIIPQSSAVAIQEAVYIGDINALQSRLQDFLLRTISYNDASSEAFYHGLMLGLCAMLDNSYYITSNRESGSGRFDIQMMPRSSKLPGVLIELKAEKDRTNEQLKDLAKAALVQIDDRKYETEMRDHKVERILKYGIAFCGKSVEVMAE